MLGAIGLQGVRLAVPTIGEFFVVTGLGLIGLLTVQILRANGCQVLGIDFDTARCKLARDFGAETVDLSKGEDPLARAEDFSRHRGVDGVLITASTKSSDPVHQAALMCRKRGRIILVGVTGMELRRADFYKKELSFQVSCSYGPGRYDPEYEEKGHDYPAPYVRWTEGRNIEAVLDLMAAGRLDVGPLISNRFEFAKAEEAYRLISDKRAVLGIMLDYTAGEADAPVGDERIISLPGARIAGSASVVVGVIGAGNYTGRTILPALAGTDVRLKTIASAGGTSATHLGKKFGAEFSTTEAESILADPEINTVFITTRHDSHAHFVRQALQAGKHVFVEKPLCLNLAELDALVSCCETAGQLLMVGFNRRFSPLVIKIKDLINENLPKNFIMTVNAGKIPADHWTQDPLVGGGRIIGEACHFIDLLRFLAASPVTGARVIAQGDSGSAAPTRDNVSISLTFADGSIGTIHYFANGDKSFPKERLEIFCAGKILQLDNFRSLRGFGWPGFSKMSLWRQDKGQEQCLNSFVEAVKSGKDSPIPFAEIEEVSRLSIELSAAADRSAGPA